MPLARCIALGVLTACLAGCDLAPRYHVPVTTVPVSYKEARAFQPAHPLDGLPRGAWWRAFGDPTLDALEPQIDGANPALAAQLAALTQARAYAAEARAGLFPTLSIGGHINTDRQSNNRPLRGSNQPNQYLDNAIDAQAHYEVDLWDRVANAVKAGRFAAQATAADLQSVRLSLHAELAADYIDLRGLDAQAQVLGDAVAAYRQALQLTENRFAGKIASGLDVSRAQSQLEAAEAALTDIGVRRALSEHAIAVLVGKLPAELSIAPARWTLHLPDIAPGLPSELLERRPDVASAERQMAAANATIGVARAAFYPTISLDVLYGLQDTGFNLFSLPNDFWAIGPGLAMPLFEGGLRRAEAGAAIAAYQRAAANYRATVLDAFQEVEDSLARQRLLGTEAQQENQAVLAARRTLAMDMNLYRDGAANFLDVVIAQAAELQSEQAAADLRTRRAQADLALVRALGGGWTASDLPAFGQETVAQARR
jgi:NodT family efflux transporter outer membrane factor (OMF) lipoprotein